MTVREMKIASGKLIIDEGGNEVEVEFGPKFNEHPLYKKHQLYYEGEKDDWLKDIMDSDRQDNEDAEDEQDNERRWDSIHVDKYETADSDDELFDPITNRDLETSDDERYGKEIDKELEEMNEAVTYEPKEILDILNFEAEEVIQDMKIDEYLAQYKEYAPTKASLIKQENSGEFYRYQ